MIHVAKYPSGKACLSLLLIAAFLVALSPTAAASDGATTPVKETAASDPATETARAAAKASHETKAVNETRAINLLYTPLNSAIRFEPAVSFAHALSQAELDAEPVVKADFTKAVKDAGFAAVVSTSATTLATMPLPPAAQDKPIKFVPMTVGEKFKYFLNSSIASPGAYGQAAFAGVRGEIFDKDEDPNGVTGHFWADSATRAARSFAFATTSKFFHRFVYASIFRQDPRYHQSYSRSAGAKIRHAVTRVFITDGNKGGSQFNISFLGGGLTAAFIARSWEREERKTTRRILSRWGNNVAITALSNILREFLSGQ